MSKGRTVYGKIKTEILFIERCLDLLKPGGRMGIVLPEGIYNNPSLLRVRQFVEDRAFIKAVVSLPQETFISSGASVKASLLFLQKYTDEEKELFDKTFVDTKAKIEAKYAVEINRETKRLEDEIAQAKDNNDAASRNVLQKELREYLKKMDEKKAEESRQLLKERFDYPIFMYEAGNVGISATGGEDENELYPNSNQPKGVEKTCVEWYREFLFDPKGFVEAGGTE